MLESLIEPGQGGYRLGVIRQDDGFSRDGLQGARLRVARGFFCFHRSSRLVDESGNNRFVQNELG